MKQILSSLIQLSGQEQTHPSRRRVYYPSEITTTPQKTLKMISVVVILPPQFLIFNNSLMNDDASGFSDKFLIHLCGLVCSDRNVFVAGLICAGYK